MNLSTEQLQLFNTCPLLLEHYILYQRETLVSRSIREGVLTTIYQVLYQMMRGRRPSQKTITDSWKETCGEIQSRFPDIARESFDFPAQCLAVFLEHYLPKSKNDEIMGVNVPFSLSFPKHTQISDVHSIDGVFQVLVRTPYGTRITIFEFDRTMRPALWIENDVFYSIPYLGYQHEFSKDPLSINIHNLGDGSSYELIRKPETLSIHREKLASILELCYSKYSFPRTDKCSSCSISIPCNTKRYA